MFAKRKLEVRVVKDENAEEAAVTTPIISISPTDITYVVREITEYAVLGTICILGAVFVKTTLDKLIDNMLS